MIPAFGGEAFMRGFGRWSWAAAFVLALGCAAEEGVAQDGEPPLQQQNGDSPPRDDKKDDDADEGPRFLATVKDKFLVEPWQVRGALLFVPEVSLFGGGGGEESRVLIVKRGAAELEVPMEQIA